MLLLIFLKGVSATIWGVVLRRKKNIKMQGGVNG
jgi:hypothetical protein